MKTTSVTCILTLCLFSSLVFNSCQKEQTSSKTLQDQEEFVAVSAESDAQAESIFNDLFDNVIGVNSEVALGGTGLFNTSVPAIPGGAAQVDSVHCYVLTITHPHPGTHFPIRAVLDFGGGCTGKDGKRRKGKIITEYSANLMATDATATTSFEGYAVDNILVEGKHIITNRTHEGNLSFVVKITAKLSKGTGDFVQWNSGRTLSQVEGQLSPTSSDDIFHVTGSANGSVRQGDKFFQWAAYITEPLVKKFTCPWVVEGGVIIKKGNDQIALLTYGAGQCDNIASFKLFGHVREITLR